MIQFRAIKGNTFSYYKREGEKTAQHIIAIFMTNAIQCWGKKELQGT